VKWDVFFSNLTFNITKAEGMVSWLRSHAKQTKEREKKKLFPFLLSISFFFLSVSLTMKCGSLKESKWVGLLNSKTIMSIDSTHMMGGGDRARIR